MPTGQNQNQFTVIYEKLSSKPIIGQDNIKEICSEMYSTVAVTGEPEIWMQLLSDYDTDPNAKYIVDRVRSGEPLSKFIPSDTQSRLTNHRQKLQNHFLQSSTGQSGAPGSTKESTNGLEYQGRHQSVEERVFERPQFSNV